MFSGHEPVNRARGCEYDGYERTIDSPYRSLRHKIETGPPAPGLTEAITGVGCRLAVTRDHEPGTPPPARAVMARGSRPAGTAAPLIPMMMGGTSHGDGQKQPGPDAPPSVRE